MRHRKAPFFVVVVLSFVLTGTADAAFPGANGKINFTSDRTLFMDPDGTGVVPAPAAGAWSPDGTRAAYDCGGGYICVKKTDGTLADYPVGGFVVGVNWSPDGSRILYGHQFCGASYCDPAEVAFFSESGGAGGGSVSKQDDIHPAWSPDGSRIAFVTYRHDPNRNLYPDSGPPTCIPCNTELYVTGVDGTGEVRLTSGPGAEFWPSWSPDGSRIAFSSTRDDPNPDDCFTTCRSEIYAMNADGTGPNLSPTIGGLRCQVQPGRPDGTKIAFTRLPATATTRSTR